MAILSKQRFYERLSREFKKDISDDTKIDNCPKLHKIIKTYNFDCDETIGERTALNLWKVILENI